MTIYTIKPLGPDTWDDFARLIERQGNGSMGAPFCWCTNFHPPDPDDNRSSEGRRAYKEQLVSQGRAHAALVFDSPEWRQVVEETIGYVLTSLRRPEGGFCSAEDADSPDAEGHGHEGLFHTWTVAEVRQA
ncbi:MAG TPA: hypothetical protein PLA46_13750, partial [Phycicoccus sp.]|nr:hypothetical protein [Phycicoccus sp.]